ncbi:polynucleotide 5'-hydroxyl-kinase NOL9 [Gadus morhua]|uniref:Polynucleotide 5'-hydroxyl-kinase NOL9 n=1 Tax=Gadus morhua TaxID=8049 RepID=A0A8C5FJ47_GADMO|nr:polynucleotide 5'-hydroxyl-kinase NOL9 [Gadus morhua]XP_030210009.1 polynucleotide 5'-hydroxyl-kinase NOL9 [Gadus morhua]
MKVNKLAPEKGARASSLKWRNTKAQRCTTRVNLSELPSTPVMVKMIKEHQAAVKKKPKVKRLERKAMTVSGSKEKKHTSFESEKTYLANTNGKSEVTMNIDADDWQEWSTNGKSSLGNGEKSADGVETVSSGRLEGESFHCCAERDEDRNHAVLVMQKSQTLCFRGKCLLTCLYGRVEVMGFTIEEGQQPYPLFSPASHCPLTVTALGSTDDARDEGMEATAILRKYLTPASQIRLLRRINLNSSVILLEPMETSLTRFLCSFPDLSELFSPPVSELMSAVLDTPLNGLGMIPLVSDVEGLRMSKSYREALNTVVSACRDDGDGCVVVLVCGTKNVGKSTFIRVLLNTLLNHTTGIDYLEGDLGQTEFTPSGCLSLSTVTEPLLGPPFTHQRTPEHMIYYGQTSCDSDLDRYLESMKSLWSRRPQSRDTPVVINTMGWVKGFGFQMLVDVLRLLPVTHVVQLGHGESMHCATLTPDLLQTAQGYLTKPPAHTAMDEFTEGHSPARTYAHLAVQSAFQGVGRQGASKHQRSNELRELSLLAYLSQLQEAHQGPVRQLNCLTPYQVPHTAVAIGVTHCEVAPSHVLYAANASLVGLCFLPEKVTSRGGPVVLSHAPLCPCVGFGVLRGIDMARGLYFLLTPVDPSILRNVNCLLLGAITLPSCILTTQSGCEEEKPYVTTDYSFDLTGAGKMRVFKGIVRPGQVGK